MRLGNKKIYHLEAWVVKVMSLYKVSVYQPLSCNSGIDWTRNKIAILSGHRAWRFRRPHLIPPAACCEGGFVLPYATTVLPLYIPQ
jgi:hypothetical protein